jgi:hypothetical protein
MRWAGHLACMEEIKSSYTILKGKNHSEDLGVDGRIILKWTLRN